jgi:methylated-DNA-protein-cysteine methyltransferase related protein
LTSPNERVALILSRVRAIPKGFVQTYGDIEPEAPRLVGHVLATTPDNVPWHRVVRADGTATQGQNQLERLRREGVAMHGNRVDMRVARWPRGATLIKRVR